MEGIILEKENLFNFSDEYLIKIRRVSREPEKRVVIGFNENQFGEAVVTTAKPVQLQPDKVSYVKKKTLPYEKYMQQQIAGKR